MCLRGVCEPLGSRLLKSSHLTLEQRANGDLPLIWGYCPGAPKTDRERKIRAKVVYRELGSRQTKWVFSKGTVKMVQNSYFVTDLLLQLKKKTVEAQRKFSH